MARKSRKHDSGKLAEYKRKLRAVKKALKEVQRGERDLDLKIKNLKKRFDEVPYHPFIDRPRSRKI